MTLIHCIVFVVTNVGEIGEMKGSRKLKSEAPERTQIAFQVAELPTPANVKRGLDTGHKTNWWSRDSEDWKTKFRCLAFAGLFFFVAIFG
jgi:hypothetical protein